MLIPILFLLTARTAYACLNHDEVPEDLKGVTVEGTYTSLPAYNREPRLYNLQRVLRDSPSSKVAALNGVDSPENQAVRDILTGNYSAAITKLHAIEATEPGNYSTAANLGTAYELAGDNENALHWITEGIRRNEQSHFGTEWLHKKILETKIAMANDPGYLKAHPIFPFVESFSWQPEFSFDYDGHSYSVDHLIEALNYQLGERMLFVKPEDPVVADLLYSFASLAANTRFLEPAVELLDLSSEYGYHDGAALEERRARYQGIIDSTWHFTWDDLKSSIVSLFFPGFVLLLFVVLPFAVLYTLAYYLVWRRTFHQSHAPSSRPGDSDTR